MSNIRKECSCVIIAAYWGTFPTNFNYWLESCRYNKTIDFLIITDNKIESIPPNVKTINMPFDFFVKLATKKIGREICIDKPYKVCDLKPCYGVIFQDYIKDYDYWAHCDMDMLFGDIRFFIEKYEITRYDRFLPLGHLCFYKNSDECNHRYMLDVDGKSLSEEAFSTYKNTVFDEIGMKRIYDAYHFPWFQDRIFIDVEITTRRMKDTCENHRHQAFLWDKGKVYHVYFDPKSEKVICKQKIYIHFQRKKMREEPVVSETVWITNNAFIQREQTGDITVGELDSINKYPGVAWEIWEDIEMRVRILVYRIAKKIIQTLGKEDYMSYKKFLASINPYWGPKV